MYVPSYRRPRLDNTRTLKLPERIHDNRSCNTNPVCDLAGNKNSLVSVKLLEDMGNCLQLGVTITC